jgi:thioredoxin 1
MAENGNTVTVTDDNFQAEISQGLSMVDFWAEWCGPCRAVAPILEQLAGDYQGQVKVAKLDVDSNPRAAAQFNVRSIPTILFFKDGQLVDTVVGAVPRQQLEQKIQLHLQKSQQAM